MRIIIPMAGIGKRMRPHTLTIPKPLIKIAGKPIVQRLVESICSVTDKKIDEICFIIGDFGKEVEDDLLKIAKNIGTNGKIYYQKEALGTGHAILCAEESLKDELIIAFADTLFIDSSSKFQVSSSKNKEQSTKHKTEKTKHKINHDGTIWVHKVKDPSLFGIVLTDENNLITEFIEKPKDFITDLAIIGIYYFKDGFNLKQELKYLIDKNILKGDEYQLTDALQNMVKKGKKLSVATVDEWLDCGNKDATVYTNQRILEHNKNNDNGSKPVSSINSVIISPCYIGENVKLQRFNNWSLCFNRAKYSY
jgi:glucose-1-phosphate thymidylyltransferase